MKPSVTITSATPPSGDRDASTLPTKVADSPEQRLLEPRLHGRRTASPLPGSVPTLSRPTRGASEPEPDLGVARRRRGRTARAVRHWPRGSPRRRAGRLARAARGAARPAPGGVIPASRPSTVTAAAIVAPVEPAETTASAEPSPHRRIATTTVGVPFGPHGPGRLLVHPRSGCGRRQDGDAVPPDRHGTSGEHVGREIRRTDEQRPRGRGRSASAAVDPGDDRRGCRVTAEEVDGDAAVRPGTSDVQHLTAVVATAGGAHGVRPDGVPAVAGGQGRRPAPSTGSGGSGCCSGTSGASGRPRQLSFGRYEVRARAAQRGSTCSCE